MCFHIVGTCLSVKILTIIMNYQQWGRKEPNTSLYGMSCVVWIYLQPASEVPLVFAEDRLVGRFMQRSCWPSPPTLPSWRHEGLVLCFEWGPLDVLEAVGQILRVDRGGGPNGARKQVMLLSSFSPTRQCRQENRLLFECTAWIDPKYKLWSLWSKSLSTTSQRPLPCWRPFCTKPASQRHRRSLPGRFCCVGSEVNGRNFEIHGCS